jgi:putative ABC transport system substrate-binding protein
LAKEAVKLHPDVIVALNTPLVAAVLDETRSIPVVFGLVSDPVGSGFAQSYARPGGNATGFAYGGSGLASKWLELLKEISPAIARVAILFNPDAAPGGGAYYLHPIEAAAPSFAITPIAAPVRNPGEIARVIAGLEGQPPSGLIVTADYFVSSQKELIITLAARHRVAAIYSWLEIGGPDVVQPRRAPRTPTRRVRRSHFEGCQAGRASGARADQVQTGDQSKNGQSARSRCTTLAARPR